MNSDSQSTPMGPYSARAAVWFGTLQWGIPASGTHGYSLLPLVAHNGSAQSAAPCAAAPVSGHHAGSIHGYPEDQECQPLGQLFPAPGLGVKDSSVKF